MVYRILKTTTMTDAAQFTARSATFGASVRSSRKPVTLLTVHDQDKGIQQFVVTDDPRIAGNAAAAVGGKAEEAEAPELEVSHLERLVSHPSSLAARETQSGATPEQVAEFLGRSLPVGVWVAVTLRAPSRSELTRARRWYDHRLGGSAIHHSRSGEVLIASVLAGGPNKHDVSHTLSSLPSAFPGWDVEARCLPLRSRLIPAVATAVALGAAVGAQVFNVPYAPMVLAFVATVCALVAIAPSPLARVRRSLSRDIFPSPARAIIPPSKPRRESTSKEGKFIPASSGGYPLARGSFLVGPSVVSGLVSPHTGTSSGSGATRTREIPHDLRQPIGPALAEVDGVPVHISQADRFGGVGSFGIPGSGKALDVRTLVRTPRGMVPLRDITVGDEVFTIGGELTVVVAQTPEFLGDCLKVVFTHPDGRVEVIADRNHLWSVGNWFWPRWEGPACGEDIRRTALSLPVGSVLSEEELCEITGAPAWEVRKVHTQVLASPNANELLWAFAQHRDGLEPGFVCPTSELDAYYFLPSGHMVVDVEDTENVMVKCISVAHPSGLFEIENGVITHNSVFIQNVFAYDSALRVRGKTEKNPLVPGDVGSKNTLIAFENKGRDGITKYVNWLREMGDAGMVIEVADETTPAIDMFDSEGTAEQRASTFVDSMVYAFGETAIGYQSANTLKVVMTAALLMTPEMVASAGLPPSSALDIASVLLSGRGDEVGRRLAGEFSAGAGQSPEIADAAERLSLLHGPSVTPSQRRNLTSAPTSKIELLQSSKSWWSPERKRTSWDTIVRNHWAVVVGTGQARNGATVPDSFTEHVTAMLMYNLQRSIIRTCADWGQTDQAVSIFSDELALLCGEGNGSIFTWLRDQGRSFGVRAVMATQRPEQLPPAVRSAIMSFGTFLWYAQNDPITAAAAAADLSADGSSWSVADVTTLRPHHGILRATVGKQREPAVPVKVRFWGDDLGGFRRDQGLE